jgi:hypothetical protein
MGPPPGALPPMRMTASWSGSNDPTAYKFAARDIRAQWRAPLGSATDRQAPSTRRSYAKSPLSQFIIAPRAQGLKRCETQAPLGRQPAQLCYRFGPLTPSARSANLIAGDAAKNGLPAPNKELAKPKHLLDTKSPYKFESPSLQKGVTCEPVPGRDRCCRLPSDNRECARR